MRQKRNLLVFVISAALISLSAVSCTDNTENEFGNPPTPETTFCDADGIEIYLEWVAESYPSITALREIGSSVAGRTLYAIEVSDNPGIAETEPEVLIAGAIHGHEQAGAGVAMKLLEDLVGGYDSGDSTTIRLVNNYRIHIIPVITQTGSKNPTATTITELI